MIATGLGAGGGWRWPCRTRSPEGQQGKAPRASRGRLDSAPDSRRCGESAHGWQNLTLKGSDFGENAALKAFHYFSPDRSRPMGSALVH